MTPGAAAGTSPASVEGFAKARRTVYCLAAAQSILGTAGPVAFSIGGVAGYQMLGPDKVLATAPLTGYNIGVAMGTVLVALLSRFAGRKLAFMAGAGLGMAGALIAAAALFRQDFWLFAIGLLAIGLSGGFAQKIRFAAADASPSFYKPQAISWILAGGVVSAVLGPQIVILAKDLFFPVTFAGALVVLSPLFLTAIIFFAMVDLPAPGANPSVGQGPARPLREIVTSLRFVTGMICGISAYALMTFMMTGAPIAMVVGCGFSSDMAILGIQWHVLAMFAPSFLTGRIIARFGAERVVAAGFVVLMACAAVAHAGIELWNFWGSLILLGIGWNFGFIGATAIIASSYRPEEADKVQAFHDIILFSTVATASFASGRVLTAYGWNWLNAVVWPVAILCLLLLAFLHISSKSRRRTA